MYAEVIVDVIHSRVATPFTYIVPEHMTLYVGSRVNVPLGARQVDGIVISLSESFESNIPLSKLRKITKRYEEYPVLLPSLLLVAKTLAAQLHCPLAETIRLMLPPAMRTGRIKTKKEIYARLNANINGEEEAEKQKRAPKRAMLIRLLSDHELHSLSELKNYTSNPKEALLALEASGIVELQSKEVYRLIEGTSFKHTVAPTLTKAQKEVLCVMLPELKRGKRYFLLHGVTGSGKTEVYMAMVEETLKLGKTAIILVPEIALTPQMTKWFQSRFGERTAVIHSRLTDGQRFDEWRRIRMGLASVVVGARSAIFAPVENLGLIVIDEEHEQSYISDKHPRYDAREVAKMRCENESATLILSSATPSIRSFAMARRGDYSLLEMRTRVNDRPMPTVTLVDMRRELEMGNRSIFSTLLLEKLKDCFEKNEQAMLFLNRRGFHTFVSCRACGHVIKCENCDVSLTMHKTETGKEELRCHMCGKKVAVPTSCPVCKSKYIRCFGSGTQRVEEELKKYFPTVKSVRMDIDTTQGRDAHAKLLAEFGSGKAQVLIGTQMIAKGLDFPKVTLVGVVAADMSLFLPDYRAAERTFQLLTQVAGRAGRAEKVGEVIVQTYKPDHPCIQAAASQDYSAFFEMEFSRRRMGLYPPFTKLARILLEGENEEKVKAEAELCYNRIVTYLDSHLAQKKRVLFMRVDEAPIKRIRGQYRYQVLMKLFDNQDVEPLIALMSELCRQEVEGVQLYTEVNPVTMM